jgi:hypothetical protein
MRLDNSISKRWWATQASARYAETGFQRFQHLCCGARLAALTFPLVPFFSPTGRGRGNVRRGVNVAHPTRHAQHLALPARQQERAADGGTERWRPNGCSDTVRSQQEIRVFDHALRAEEG